MEKWKNKVIWITGASSGIGKELAFQLSKKGCKLILSSRSVEELQQVANSLPETNGVTVIALDLNDYTNIHHTVETAWLSFGKIDMLINNAGISQRSLIAETTMNVYEQLVRTNYLGTVALSKALLPYFIERKAGHYVTVTSVMGKFGSPYRSGYCGAKHALHGFFDVLRMEHEKDNVKVTMICPGFVQTHIAKNALTADGSAQGNNDVKTQSGLTVNVFCKQMISAITKNKFEAYIGKKEILGVYVKRFFPNLLHKMVLKSTVR